MQSAEPLSKWEQLKNDLCDAQARAYASRRELTLVKSKMEETTRKLLASEADNAALRNDIHDMHKAVSECRKNARRSQNSKDMQILKLKRRSKLRPAAGSKGYAKQ